MKILTTADFAAPANLVWQIIGEEFGEIGRWTGLLTGSSLIGPLGVGGVRECRFEPDMFSRDGRLLEALVHFDRQARELEYVAVSPPWFLRRAGSRWKVEATDDAHSRVVLTGEVRLHWAAIVFAPILRWMLGRMAARLLSDLRAHAAVRQQGWRQTPDSGVPG